MYYNGHSFRDLAKIIQKSLKPEGIWFIQQGQPWFPDTMKIGDIQIGESWVPEEMKNGYIKIEFGDFEPKKSVICAIYKEHENYKINKNGKIFPVNIPEDQMGDSRAEESIIRTLCRATKALQIKENTEVALFDSAAHLQEAVSGFFQDFGFSRAELRMNFEDDLKIYQNDKEVTSLGGKLKIGQSLKINFYSGTGNSEVKEATYLYEGITKVAGEELSNTRDRGVSAIIVTK